MTQFEKTFHLMKKPGVIIVYALLTIAAYIAVDKNLATFFYHLDLRTKIHALSIFTALGLWIAYIGVFFCAALYFRFIKINKIFETRAWYLLGCVMIANLVCFVLKVSLSRARPDLLFANNEFGFYWFKLNKLYWSFPSGHTTTVISLAVGVGVLFQRHFYTVLFIGILVAVSRVLLYHHYLSDVMAGFYLSLLVVGFFTEYLKNNKWITKRDLLFPKRVQKIEGAINVIV